MNPIYEAGTISVAAGGTTVTGQNTLFLTQGIRPGDQFRAQGLSATIVSVNSNTSLTIKPWPGQAINTGNYEILRVSDANRLLDATFLLMANLSNNLLALGQLQGAANKQPYFTGPNTLALADLTAFGRAMQGLTGSPGSFVRATGAGTAVMQAILGAVSQSAGVPTGALMEFGSNANGDFFRFANGLQVCVREYDATNDAWSTANGTLFRSSNVVWSYPASFTRLTPVILGATSRSSDEIRSLGVRNITTSACNVYAWAAQSSAAGAAKTMHMAAIGAWV